MLRVQTYINGGPGMFMGYEKRDLLVTGPVVVLDETRVVTGPNSSAQDVDVMWLEHVWAIGNRMGRDHEGNEWPSGVRSLSMGDVAVIGETAYSIAVVGWDPISTDDLVESLDPTKALPNPRIVEAYRA